MRRVYLESISANGGYLENVGFTFSPALNCIIGARGTCKSTIVESIAFATQTASPANKRVRETLGSGSIKCVLRIQDGANAESLVVERELDVASRISRTGNLHHNTELDFLEDIEVYTQGALQDIATSDEPGQRLRLIDRPNRSKLASIKPQIDQHVSALKQIGVKARMCKLDIERLSSEVRDLPQVRAELEQLLQGRPTLPPSLAQQHASYLERQRTLAILSEIRQIQHDTITALTNVLKLELTLDSTRERTAIDATAFKHVLIPLLDQLASALSIAATATDASRSVPIDTELDRLRSEFAPFDELYHTARQQEQAVSDSLKREDYLTRRLAELERAQRDLDSTRNSLNDLSLTRRESRLRLAALQETTFEARVLEVDKINSEFGNVIVLAVQRAAFSQPYINQLTHLLGGSRLRDQDEIAKSLARSLSPSELLQAVEDNDATRVASLLSRDIGQVSRILSYLRDHPDLYELENALLDDTLEITMFDKGVPKQVDQLSAGQRATALLPLILRSAQGPLIIDQPEDDLDNSFVFEVLVKNVTALKSDRQLIFVTHNANIPVLGEAENIIVMEMDTPRKAATPRIGSLDERKDDVLHLLEGGREAFERREARYQSPHK